MLPTDPQHCECERLQSTVDRLQVEVVAIRVRLGWLFGALGVVGALDFLPR